MDTINESDLFDFMRNKAVKRLDIVQTQEGKFRVVVKLTWKEGDFHLVTFRKSPREWASLDTLVRLIQEKGGEPPPVTLSLIKHGDPNK